MEPDREVSRRTLLRAGAASVLALVATPRAGGAQHAAALASQLVSRAAWPTGAPGASSAPSPAPNPVGHAARPPIGLQLYTVRSLMQRDVPGTLAALSEAGVREVEFAGYFDRSARSLRTLLDAHGLSAPAAHVPIPSDWSPVIDDAEALGHRWLVVPWVGPEVRASLSGWHRLADQLNEAGRLAAARGLRVAYHNHDFEFTPTEGRVPFEVLIQRLDASLVDLELDLYWTVKAGHDPRDLFARHPGRFPLWHLKDAGPAPQRAMLDVGAGTIDFAGLFALADQAGLRHAFIEHDQPADPMASVRAGVEALRRIG